jgi:pyrroloquinoline quinone biosynthesis protein E
MNDYPTSGPAASPPAAPRPFALLAELTYRCPLHCPYCSNPAPLPGLAGALTTEEWRAVLRAAADLGVLQVHFSGGEPLLRPDVDILVRAAREAGLYTNLLTSALGLTPMRVERLRAAGLDHVQISIQADDDRTADAIAGTIAHADKIRAARTVHKLGLALTLNVVLHRDNIDHVAALIGLAEEVGAERLELAHTQYHGWAFHNAAALLPSRAEVVAAGEVVAAARERLGDRLQIAYVLADYYADRPKPCMHGWGRQSLTVNPTGDVLPCPTAQGIPGLAFENVRARPLARIWSESEAFNRFRGISWMPHPCRTCDQREVDFGGCRCQAALLTGDAANTDPVCSLSPHHAALRQWVARVHGERTDHPSARPRVPSRMALSPLLDGLGKVAGGAQ